MNTLKRTTQIGQKFLIIPDRVSIICGSRSGKTNYLRNYHQPTFINYNYMEDLPLNQSINC